MNKNYDAAINYFKKSLTFDSKDIQTLYNTGLAYYRISDIASAKKYMNTCLIVQPNYKPATELLKRIK
jgi:tetratricopeptide (TPR) repeat protein